MVYLFDLIIVTFTINMSQKDNSSHQDLQKSKPTTEAPTSSSKKVLKYVHQILQGIFYFKLKTYLEILMGVENLLPSCFGSFSSYLQKSVYFSDSSVVLRNQGRQHLGNVGLWSSLCFPFLCNIRLIQLMDWLIHYYFD